MMLVVPDWTFAPWYKEWEALCKNYIVFKEPVYLTTVGKIRPKPWWHTEFGILNGSLQRARKPPHVKSHDKKGYRGGILSNILYMAPPEFSATMRHKAATIFRLQALSLSFQQATPTDPTTWCKYLVTDELLETEPRPEDFYSPVQTTLPVLRPTQPVPLPTAPLPARWNRATDPHICLHSLHHNTPPMPVILKHRFTLPMHHLSL